MLTLQRPATYETTIKKSRFVVVAARADDPDLAIAFREEERVPHATHNCWAFRIGVHYRFSDDGEPGGTAGRPILAAIDGQQLDHVVVLVTRYFGGIKLGTGGLVRAYGGAAAECLRLACRIELKRQCRLHIRIPFDAMGVVYPLIDRFGANRAGEECDNHGVVLLVDVTEDHVAAITSAVQDATRGVGHVVSVDRPSQ